MYFFYQYYTKTGLFKNSTDVIGSGTLIHCRIDLGHNTSIKIQGSVNLTQSDQCFT